MQDSKTILDVVPLKRGVGGESQRIAMPCVEGEVRGHERGLRAGEGKHGGRAEAEMGTERNRD